MVVPYWVWVLAGIALFLAILWMLGVRVGVDA
jgi:hypothetical protein